MSDCWPIIHSVKVLNSNDLIKIIEVDINLANIFPDTSTEFTINFDKPFSELPEVLISLIGMKYKSTDQMIQGDEVGIDISSVNIEEKFSRFKDRIVLTIRYFGSSIKFLSAKFRIQALNYEKIFPSENHFYFLSRNNLFYIDFQSKYYEFKY